MIRFYLENGLVFGLRISLNRNQNVLLIQKQKASSTYFLWWPAVESVHNELHRDGAFRVFGIVSITMMYIATLCMLSGGSVSHYFTVIVSSRRLTPPVHTLHTSTINVVPSNVLWHTRKEWRNKPMTAKTWTHFKTDWPPVDFFPQSQDIDRFHHQLASFMNSCGFPWGKALPGSVEKKWDIIRRVLLMLSYKLTVVWI